MTSAFTPPEEVTTKWQSVVNIMAKMIDVPVGLIMRVNGPDIEVLVSSHTDDNPYTPGDHEHLCGSGLYCETVIKNQDKLLVPDALLDETWKSNPDIKFGLVSYLGFPIIAPGGDVFGTLCVLDNKANSYTTLIEDYMVELKGVIESHLALFDAKNKLETRNRQLEDSLAEIQTLRGIIPICSYCKDIRDDEGFWQRVESYFSRHTGSNFTHGVCPDCLMEHHPDHAEEILSKF